MTPAAGMAPTPAVSGTAIQPQTPTTGRDPVASRHSLGARAALALIRLYQGVRAGRPSPCRYWPTCSEYAREAVEGHGFWRGGSLTARRLGRCRPLGGHGFDPVPAPRADRERA